MADTNQPTPNNTNGADPALNVIRAKLNALYGEEPDVVEEAEESIQTIESGEKPSKHQKFMYELSRSGKPLAEIQTQWHNYYVGLPDKEKHEVWREFYSKHDEASKHSAKTPPLPHHTAKKPEHDKPEKNHSPQSVADVKKRIIKNAFTNSKLAKNHHVRSLVFGLGMGSLVILVFLFGFFNERFIAPFITPSRSVSTTPIIIDPSNAAVSEDPKIIIPKINVEIPVVYGVSTQEKAIQEGLEDGVVHMSNTPLPGEQGNTAIVGHSSNNLFNRGKYKFAFVLLSRLEKGDTFYINRGGTRYVYKIYEKKVVPPTDLSVLDNNDKTATATLITCDPPGSSVNRLIIVGEQISPNPNKNAKSEVSEPVETSVVPGNAPSLWRRILDSFSD